ncbi:MAG: Asp-tRNA(Asn)/Glu-tRNA(Gln) amidotransferase subunit GatA [Phycisphaerae bacterium]
MATAIRRRRVSATEAVRGCLKRIEAIDGGLGAFVHLEGERALARATSIDAQLAAGESVGSLAGVPVAIKDNLCTTFGPTTCASAMLADFRAPYNAHVVDLLERAGAVIVGKTNLDEFAMGSSTENSGRFCCRNPWDTKRVPGGSSGGSCVAVSAGMVPGALGSDTGGSVRQPAAFCGLVGLKPTYGRVSRYGLVAFASSLDQIGPIGRTAEDVAKLAGVIAGHDSRDSTSADKPVPDYVTSLETSLKGLRVGVVAESLGPGLEATVRRRVESAIELLKAEGAQVEEVHLPHMQHAVACYYLVATAEASSNLARYDGVHFGHRSKRCDDVIEMVAASRAEGFGAEVQRRIMLGTYALSAGYYDAYYLKALKVRALIKADFDRAFEQVDVLVCPTTPTTAFSLGEKADDPLAMYLADVYTVSANLAGICAVSVPCGFDDGGLPVGMQLMGAAFAEARLLGVAHQYQLRTDFHRQRPPV